MMFWLKQKKRRNLLAQLLLVMTFTQMFQAEHCQAATESITLIGEDDWYPYAGLQNGKLQGLAVDLIAAAYAAVNLKVEFQAAPYARCLMLVETGQALGCFDSLKDSNLSQRFLFHQVPVFEAEIGIYAPADSNASGLRAEDLRGQRLGLTHGYTYTDAIDRDPSILREEAPTDLSNLRKLLLRRSDYSLVYSRVVDYLQRRYAHEFRGKLKKVGTLTIDKLYVSFSKKRPESQRQADLLDQGLRLLKQDGSYDKIIQRWQNSAN